MRLVTEMDMNNKKAKENTPPAFRPAEVGGPGGGFVGLNRVFESAILGLWDEFTPLAQPTAWRERGGKKKENREREIEMGEGDPRSSAHARADLRHARCYSSLVSNPQKSQKITQKISPPASA